jgi:hypothetical protein
VTLLASSEMSAAITSQSTWRKLVRYSFGPSDVRLTKRWVAAAIEVDISLPLLRKSLTAHWKRVDWKRSLGTQIPPRHQASLDLTWSVSVAKQNALQVKLFIGT